jgi:uncharacterized protein YgbK (DUF1537 family)
VDGIIRARHPEPRPADGIPLAGQLGGPARLIGLADVRDGARLTRSLAAARSAGQLAACDAATDQDLDEIVAAGLALGTPVLWAGAAGLAAALARALLGAPGSELALPATPPRDSAPLTIIGSHSPAARAQVRELLADGIQGISLRPGDLLAMTEPERVRYGADLALASAAAPTVVWLDGEVDHAAWPVDDAARPAVAGALGELCAAAVASARVVIAAGGATARAVLVPSGVAALALLGEVEPGAVLSRAVPARDLPARDLPAPAVAARDVPGRAVHPRPARHVITKSGSFGDAATLVRLVTAITQPEGTG